MSAQRAPASFSQQRLWFLHQLEPGTPAYNIARCLRLTGPLNIDALRDSLAAVVRRHAALRTTFAMEDGDVIQLISQEARFEFLELKPEANQSNAVSSEAISGEAQRPFDLRNGPLLRAALLRTSPEDHTLCLTIHH